MEVSGGECFIEVGGSMEVGDLWIWVPYVGGCLM